MSGMSGITGHPEALKDDATAEDSETTRGNGTTEQSGTTTANETPTHDDEDDAEKRAVEELRLVNTRYEENGCTDPWKDEEYADFFQKFKLDRDGELMQRSFSAEELEEFILKHPFKQSTQSPVDEFGRPNFDQNLVLWLQKTPMVTHRYANNESDGCLFEECPSVNNRILKGWYRIALDNRWSKYGELQNPYIVAGYVHLYCIEKFLDFAHICRNGDVRADDRRALKFEPDGDFAARLKEETVIHTREQIDLVDSFIDYAKGEATDNRWANYPTRPPDPWVYEGCLSHAIYEHKAQSLGKAKRNQFARRGGTTTNFLSHLGDLEKYEAAVIARKENRTAPDAAIVADSHLIDEDGNFVMRNASATQNQSEDDDTILPAWCFEGGDMPREMVEQGVWTEAKAIRMARKAGVELDSLLCPRLDTVPSERPRKRRSKKKHKSRHKSKSKSKRRKHKRKRSDVDSSSANETDTNVDHAEREDEPEDAPHGKKRRRRDSYQENLQLLGPVIDYLRKDEASAAGPNKTSKR